MSVYDGNCMARASPTEIKALRNMGGPANKFIMMTDICMGASRSQKHRSEQHCTVNGEPCNTPCIHR